LSNFISVARITRTRGIRGEVAAEILTDFPERFSSLVEVRVASESFESFEEIENFWFQKSQIILKFKGRNRPHEVEELVGKDVQIPEAERVELPEDTYFDSDLEGCLVLENNQPIGRVVRVDKGSLENPNLVVQVDEVQEFMIPVVKQFILEVDLDSKSIHVELPSGLIELTITKHKSGK
jgi:16S rRNA processing protein RimM